MCGIFGYVGTSEQWGDVFRFLSALAVATEKRGPHSTGYAALNGAGIFHAKAPLPASEYVATKKWTRIGARPSEIVIGHCRYATTGAPAVNRNNHPHVGRGLALVHNGVLRGHRLVAARESIDLTTECDSEVILRVLEKHGIRTGVERLFRDVLGGLNRSAAVAVIEVSERRLALFRSIDRPLYVVRIPELGDAVFFSSTAEIMLEAMVLAFGRQLETASAFSTLPGRLYWIRPNGASPAIETEDIAYKTVDPWPTSSWAEPLGVRQMEMEWDEFVCFRCGYRLTYRAGHVDECPRCHDIPEEMKKCHDCGEMISEFGPVRCAACADKHRRRERNRRNRTARKHGGYLTSVH